jgi:hypothetical protein
MLHHKKPRNRKGYGAFLFCRGQIMGKILKSKVNDLGGLLVLTINLVAVCAIGVHALGVADVFLDGRLAELVLHHGDEGVAE